jgi:hypothetical protein
MRSRNFVVGLVSSVLVLVVAGALLVLLESGDDEVDLPDEVAGLTAADTAGAYPDDAPDPQSLIDARTAAQDVDRVGLTEAYDGAAAGSRVYVDRAYEAVVSFTAVEADAGPLVPPNGFVDPEALGFALPQVERVTDGDVECLLTRNQPPRAGTDYQDDQALPDAVTCQRRSGALTVRARAATQDRDLVVEVVEDVWGELD